MPRPNDDGKRTIADLLSSATAAELTALDEQIAAVEKYITDQENLRLSLKALRRLVDVKLNGKKPRIKKAPKAAPPAEPVEPPRSVMGGRPEDQNQRLGDRVWEMVRHNGAMHAGDVARKLGVTPGQINMAAARHQKLKRDLMDRITVAG